MHGHPEDDARRKVLPHEDTDTRGPSTRIRRLGRWLADGPSRRSLKVGAPRRPRYSCAAKMRAGAPSLLIAAGRVSANPGQGILVSPLAGLSQTRIVVPSRYGPCWEYPRS